MRIYNNKEPQTLYQWDNIPDWEDDYTWDNDTGYGGDSMKTYTTRRGIMDDDWKNLDTGGDPDWDGPDWTDRP